MKGASLTVEGWLDSAQDTSIGGWVRLQPTVEEAAVILRDETRPEFAYMFPLISARNDVKGGFGFIFKGLDPQQMLLLLIGKAWVEVCSLPLGTIKKIFNGKPKQINDYILIEKLSTSMLGRLPVYEGFRSQAIEAIAIGVEVNFSFDHIAREIDRISPHASPWELTFDRSSLSNPPKQTSSFEVPVGLVSRDQSTIVGTQGHLFLYKGNNYLLDQYVDTPEARKRAKQWDQLITARKAFAEEMGSRFLQVLIPEKTSALVEQFPQSLDAPTYSLRHFRSEVKDTDVVLDLLPEIRSDTQRIDFYRKIDAHFSYYGCYKVFCSIIKSLGIANLPKVTMEHPKIIRGDIGGRFPGFVETQLAPEPKFLSDLSPVETYRHLPPNHRHEGITVHWRNPAAPVKMKVIACANSFFAMGDEAHELSWWFSRWFEDFHFIWTRHLDMDHIRKERPDIIIAQTIERFLPVVPDR